MSSKCMEAKEKMAWSVPNRLGLGQCTMMLLWGWTWLEQPGHPGSGGNRQHASLCLHCGSNAFRAFQIPSWGPDPGFGKSPPLEKWSLSLHLLAMCIFSGSGHQDALDSLVCLDVLLPSHWTKDGTAQSITVPRFTKNTCNTNHNREWFSKALDLICRPATTSHHSFNLLCHFIYILPVLESKSEEHCRWLVATS